jgi:hypothetical protein
MVFDEIVQAPAERRRHSRQAPSNREIVAASQHWRGPLARLARIAHARRLDRFL